MQPLPHSRANLAAWAAVAHIPVGSHEGDTIAIVMGSVVWGVIVYGALRITRSQLLLSLSRRKG